MEKFVLIVAGGKGLRMGTVLPKQFLPVGGKPVLLRTLETFYACDPTFRIILVLPAEQQVYWRQLCMLHHCNIPHQLVNGGETRFQSVKNGLEKVEGEGLVAVHDGVRPFVSAEVIRVSFDSARRNGAAIPVVEVIETLRHVGEGVSCTVPRSDYCLVQTPQVFLVELLKRAYGQPYSEAFTDDASVVESMGIPVTLIPGNRENIKITTPFDLKIANALL